LGVTTSEPTSRLNHIEARSAEGIVDQLSSGGLIFPRNGPLRLGERPALPWRTGHLPMIEDLTSPNRLASNDKLKDLHYIVWGLLLVCFILPFFIVVITNHQPPDADFAEFYGLGRILNEYSPHDLYNYDLQKRICEEVHPRTGGYGPLPYPPFVALLFRPATLLPYWMAYALWVLASLLLYAAGLWMVLRRFFPNESRATWSLVYALAFSYFPFIAYTAGNGQLATVGFCAIALALQEEERHREMTSGLALSTCLYKPTLLILILPMLLVTRRFRALGGFGLGALLLFVGTIPFEGFAIWSEFFRTILSFGNSSVGVTNHSILPLEKYADLTSFSSQLHGGRSPLGIAVFLCIGLAVSGALVRFWWIARRYGATYNALLWAATLTWTLLVNVYVPLYDSILVVLSLLFTAAATRNIGGKAIRRWFTVTWILILVCSWFSVPLSRSTSVQCMTLLFASLGILQFVCLGQLASKRGAIRCQC